MGRDLSTLGTSREKQDSIQLGENTCCQQSCKSLLVQLLLLGVASHKKPLIWMDAFYTGETKRRGAALKQEWAAATNEDLSSREEALRKRMLSLQDSFHGGAIALPEPPRQLVETDEQAQHLASERFPQPRCNGSETSQDERPLMRDKAVFAWE